MIKYHGTALNISYPMIARVEKNHFSSRILKNSMFVTDAIPKLMIGYKAIISGQKSITEQISGASIPLVYGVEGLENLKEGDVLLIEPNGLINVLYQKASNDNAILLTENCNASCIMCSQPMENSEAVTNNINEKLIKLMNKNTKFLGITGGEPTTAKSELVKTIIACKKYLPNTGINLLTNGILLEDFEYVKDIASIGHPNLIFQIPIYSDTDTEHNKIVGKDAFYKTIKGLHNLALFRQKIELRTVIFSLNYKRLPGIAEFIYRNFPFVAHVALMGLEVIHRARENIKLLWIDPHLYGNELFKAVQILHRADINVSIYNHQLCIIPKSLRQFARKSISDWKRGYPSICEECAVRNDCGGVFTTSEKWLSKYLQPIKMGAEEINNN